MSYDIVIKSGTIIDGSGGVAYKSDIAVKDGRIAAFGRISDAAAQVIDASDLVVAPGIIDAHTHLDAQVAWDPLATSSCWHGVTSAVMGNCGFSLAPCREGWKEKIIRGLEAVEAIPADAMLSGIDWRWTTYPQYLENLDRLPKGINFGGYIGHTALRTFVMGERAYSDKATDEDIAAMQAQVREALRAGAMGFSTSRGEHITPEGKPVPSRICDWDEVRSLVKVLEDANVGVFELARDVSDVGYRQLRELALGTSVPVTFGCVPRIEDSYTRWLDIADEAAKRGGRVAIQAHTRTLNCVWCFESQLPWERHPVWRDLRKLSLAEQKVALHDKDFQRKLVAAAYEDPGRAIEMGTVARIKDPKEFEVITVLRRPGRTNPSIAAEARERGIDPVQLVIDLSLESDFKQMFFQPLQVPDQDGTWAIINHPHSVVTFSDSGAHASQICDYSLQTELLSYWVRERQALTLERAVRKITFDIASVWGLHDRGLLREGLAADIMIFDPARIAPAYPQVVHDLPAGALRLTQKAIGMHYTIVNGQVLMRNGEHTGALPGTVLRNRWARGGAH